MKFHLFSRVTSSSDFETRLGHLTTFEDDGMEGILAQFVEYRYEYRYESFDWGKEFTEEEMKHKFVKELFSCVPSMPRTPVGMLMVVKNIQNMNLPKKASDELVRKILNSVNDDFKVAEPLLIIEETDENVLLLRHLGVE